jgi:hypothetical protein
VADASRRERLRKRTSVDLADERLDSRLETLGRKERRLREKMAQLLEEEQHALRSPEGASTNLTEMTSELEDVLVRVV